MFFFLVKTKSNPTVCHQLELVGVGVGLGLTKITKIMMGVKIQLKIFKITKITTSTRGGGISGPCWIFETFPTNEYLEQSDLVITNIL